MGYLHLDTHDYARSPKYNIFTQMIVTGKKALSVATLCTQQLQK